MRVLHVIGAMDRGGAETLIMNLYRAMDRTAIQFDFLVHEERPCDYDEEILALGGRLFRLPRFTGANAIDYRGRCRRFFSEHPEHRVVHGHIGSSAAIYLREAKRAGRFAVAHSHSQNFTPGLPGVGFRIASFPTRHIADYFFACSLEAGKDRFGEAVVKGDAFSVMCNGVDLSLYSTDDAEHRAMRATFGLGDVPVFGHVGRLTEVKNHRFLFKVFAAVRKELPGAVLLLAGRGPLEDELRSHAGELGISDAVRFLGVCEHVPDLLKALDVFVFPSVKEGLPLAAVEAQAAGLPCLLSTGVPDLAVVSSLGRRIPLAAGVDAWASACVEAYRRTQASPRCDAVSEVRGSGFDIRDTAQRLSEFYLLHQGGS